MMPLSQKPPIPISESNESRLHVLLNCPPLIRPLFHCRRCEIRLFPHPDLEEY